MKPEKFDQQTHVLKSALGETPLMADPISGLAVIRVRATWRELLNLLFNGRLFYVAAIMPTNQPFPVVALTTDMQFRTPTGEEVAKLEKERKKGRVKEIASKRKFKR